MQDLNQGNNFATLATDLNVAQATAEVYGIDCLAAGADLNHETMATFLNVTEESFEIIISHRKGQPRRSLYNQIRFVLACLIHDLEI